VLVLVAACGGGRNAADAASDVGPPIIDAIPCGVVGDPGQPTEMQVIYRTETGAALVIDGATLPLVDPPQGGKILLVGARVKNLDLCTASVQVALKDLTSGYVVGLERRSVTWAIAPDGFAEPSEPVSFYDYANVPVCPNANITQSIYGNPWQLEVRVYEGDVMAAEQLLTVTPSCAASADPAGCMCYCAVGGGGNCGLGGGLDGGTGLAGPAALQ
jgi:hypothetical protein